MQEATAFTWKDVRSNRGLRIRLVLTLILLPGTAYCFSVFLQWVEQRGGHMMYDPVLALFEPVNVSIITFIVTYLPIAALAVYAARFPVLLMQAAAAYTILLLLRMLSLYFVPLEPPASMIPLRDPLLELVVYEGNANLKDLFFSGHTATPFMFFLLMKNKGWKICFLICTVLAGMLVLLQHVHYTADVLAAPAFAWAAVQCSSYASREARG